MKRGYIIAFIILVVLVGGLGVWVIYHPETKPVTATQTASSTSNSEAFGPDSGFVRGSIEVLNDNGFTVTLPNGTTKDITLTATTTVQNFTSTSSSPTAITADQLSVGEEVIVAGALQADGSIIADRVLSGNLPQPNRIR